MIFASVGSMMPFDRMTRAIDEWAAEHPHVPVFLQIGDGEYEPKACEWKRMVPHGEYQRHLNACQLFVAHVGMGSILQALEIGKQTLLMPRRASLREHTTDHQLDTAGKFRNRPGLLIVEEAAELQAQMTRLIEQPMEGPQGIAPDAPAETIANIRAHLAQFAKA
ncbi:hypothetical protein C7I55_17675 [Sphingomonas deserti]|uniref:Glycosyl transferase family 28 C-terminal domain-containing protein n=2 Tax=Allosphingosinicella deserti TaxID=2116704 RepID=A0A2P7QK06_9SPHN|nr:hypothetical protein C7I55_17675 [Sphingomonas deserti]